MKKMLKYDLKAVAKMWWLIAVATIFFALTGAGALRGAIELFKSETAPLIALLMIIYVFFAIFAIAVGGFVTSILVYLRFYKNLFTDEGYLTFTLPVSRSSIFFAKTLNAFIWSVANGILIAVSVLIFTLFLSGITEDVGGPAFAEMLEMLGLGVFTNAPGFITILALESLIALAASSFFGICLIELCITVASVVAKKGKLIVAIAIYILSSNVLGVAVEIFSIFASLILGPGFATIGSSIGVGGQRALICVGIMMVVAIIAAIGAVLYAITQNLIERKLNLA